MIQNSEYLSFDGSIRNIHMFAESQFNEQGNVIRLIGKVEGYYRSKTDNGSTSGFKRLS